MAQITPLQDTATKLALGKADCPVIQNLGPDDLYFGQNNTVTDETGIRLLPGEGFGFDRPLVEAGWDAVWVYTTGSADVRYASVG